MSEKIWNTIGDGIQHTHRLFPRIAEKIVALWESDDFDEYLNSLVVADRPGRQGFPPEVASELILLSLLRDKYRRAIDEGNPWVLEKKMEEDKVAQFKNELAAQGAEFGPQCFFEVVKQGDTRTALDFVRAGMDIDTKGDDQWTPLMLALFHKQEETALMFIQRGANVNAVADRGYQPIHWAVLSDYLKVADLILSRGGDVNGATAFGWTPLLQAATKGSLDMTKLLVGANAYVNAVEHQGYSALHKACANEHVEIVRFLLANHADSNLRSMDGTTPLALARRKKRQDIADLLSAFGARD